MPDAAPAGWKARGVGTVLTPGVTGNERGIDHDR